mmetsp:Transcript_14157/g.25940  ORF Transcript_14157/g.25940 Transcript_14157/m.25940 type:complete len:207 (-) Transcript_14157:1181-1801(-)
MVWTAMAQFSCAINPPVKKGTFSSSLMASSSWNDSALQGMNSRIPLSGTMSMVSFMGSSASTEMSCPPTLIVTDASFPSLPSAIALHWRLQDACLKFSLHSSSVGKRTSGAQSWVSVCPQNLHLKSGQTIPDMSGSASVELRIGSTVAASLLPSARLICRDEVWAVKASSLFLLRLCLTASCSSLSFFFSAAAMASGVRNEEVMVG